MTPKKNVVPLIIFYVLLFLVSLFGFTLARNFKLQHSQLAEPLPKPSCEIGGIVQGCGYGKDGKTILLLSEPPPQGVSAEFDGYSADEYIETGEWFLLTQPTPVNITVDNPPVINIIIQQDAVPTPQVTDVPGNPTPTPTQIPTPPPAQSYVLYPGMSVAHETIGRCTFSFPAYYNNPGHVWHGTRFGITNAHCITDPSVGYACKDCYGDKILSPGGMDGGTISKDFIGYTAYWYPPDNSSTVERKYDAGAFKLCDSSDNLCSGFKYTNPSLDLPQLGTSYQATITNFDTWADVDTQLEGVGATSGYMRVKVVATDVCVYVGVTQEGVLFCDQFVIQGLKKEDGTRWSAMQPGDSGSLFILRDSYSSKTAICLGFAGSASGYGLCSRISEVMKGMRLSFAKP